MATQAEKAMAKMLLSQFNNQMSPINLASKVKLSELNGIKSSITNIDVGDFTPIGAFQTTVDGALDDAFKSSAWLVAETANDKIQAIQTQCDFLGKMGIGQAIDKMAAGVVQDSIDAAGSAIDAAKAALGFSMPEFGIGSALSDLINKGASITEPVRKELEGTVSAILETGKGVAARASELASQVNGVVDDGIDLVSKGLSTLAGPLKELDKLINCVTEIGGSEFSSEATQMVDSLNQVYTDLGIHDDPTQRNFGEFNTDTFFDSMPSVTTDQKENILKSTNMYDQSKNNATATVAAAKSKAIKSESSESALSSGEGDNIEVKKQDIEERTKVEFEDKAAPALPASPGQAELPAKVAATSQPTAPEVSYIREAPTPAVEPQPVGTPYWQLAEQPTMVNEDIMINYLFYDPGKNGYPEMFKQLWEKMPDGFTTKTTTEKIYLSMTVTSVKISQPFEDDVNSKPSGQVQWNRVETTCEIFAYSYAASWTSGLTRTLKGVFNSKKVDVDVFKAATGFGLSIVIGRVVGISIRDNAPEWTAAEFDSLL